jgi:hypothetical protein
MIARPAAMDRSQRRCPECWELYTIGRRHDCKAARPTVTTSPPAPVKNANAVKNAVKNALPNTSSKRTAKWRDAHREESRNYMRAYMRRYRAEARPE